ncbi:MAG: response regulator transcription factor [Succinivibrionaceae bacterium]|nr:response regulator transcription factor [Succinivibrionaceae bacterium]
MSKVKPLVHCVEDDSDIREIEVYTLRAMGMEAEGFADAGSFLRTLGAGDLPSLALLDVMLPDQDGVAVLRQIRAQARTHALPVIMATARGAEHERISALDLGADDYLTKPFSMLEMVARVKAVLRRCEGERGDCTVAGNVRISESRREAFSEGRPLDLTRREFELLLLLVRHPGRVFTREQLLSQIWGLEYDGENRTVDVHVRTLRQKLGKDEGLIRTVRGIGYKAEC